MSIIDHDIEKKNKKSKSDLKNEIKIKQKFILSVTENGYGKRTSHYDFRVTNRGGKGIIGIVNSSKPTAVELILLLFLPTVTRAAPAL